MSLLSFFSYAQLAQEGFEAGWTLASTGTSTTGWFTMENGIGTNVKWVQGPIGSAAQPPHTGQQAAYLNRENVTTGIPEDYLVTPQFVVPPAAELRFFSRLTVLDDQGSIYKVFIVNLTDNPTANLNSPASYTELQSWTEFQINPVQTEYYEKVVEIPAAYEGKNVRIAFMMAGDFMDRWLIDDVKVAAKCLAPTNLLAENITLDSAQLTWTNPTGVTSWEVELRGEDEVPTGSGTVYNTALPITINGLAEDTCYKYYARSVCSDGGLSDWVGPFYFCTKRRGDDCQDPIVIAGLPYSDTDNTAGFADAYNGMPGTGCGNSPWEDYLSGNDVVYQYNATFTGAINIDLTDNGQNSGIFVYNECSNIGSACLAGGTAGFDGNPVSLDDFPVTAGEDYFIVISSYSNVTTPYTITIQAVACDEPTNLSVDNIAMTSVQLSWDNPTGATSWGVVVQPAGGGVPSGAGTTVTDNSDYLWTSLTASTAYEYWVRADCGNGTFSAWAGPFRFNTMICDLPFQCEFTFTMWDMWNNWDGHTMSVKQNGITLATLTGPDSSGDPVEQVVKVCDGMPVQLFWNAGGSSWAASEVAISVKNSFGQTIYTKPFEQGMPNTLLYEVTVDCQKPYCLPPGGLTATNATETTVDLGWEGGPTGDWEYYIVTEGSPAPTATTTGVMTTSNPTVGAGPLVASTNYEYYVRMHCEDASTDVSAWGGPFKFSSSVCPIAEKCNYTFILNASWGGWNGAEMTIIQNNTNVAVLGPSFTDGTSQTVTVPLCTEVPFEIFWNTVGDSWEGNVGLEVINNFDQTLYELPLFSSGFVGTTLFEADFNCLYPACLPPTGLNSANGTMTSIDLGWDGPATGEWEYVVLPAGSPAPTATTPGTATTSNPTVGVPLAAPATNYEYYVRVVCTGAATPTSAWAGPFAIHSEACMPEDKCMFHFELLSQNGWGYEDNTMTVYQAGVPAVVLGPGFDWGAPSQDSFIVDVPLCPNLPIEIVWNTGGWGESDKGLKVYSPYWEDVYFKDFGEGAQGETLFTGLVTCDPPACIKPWDLQVSDIQLNSAELSWDTQGSDATSWEIWVVPYGDPAPDPATTPGTVVTTNPYVWNDLDSGTPYQFYIRANCEADGFSTVTGAKTFVTAIENDDCDAAIALTVNSGVECVTSTAGTMSGSTSSGVAPSCAWGTAPDYDVWYQFVATDANAVISVKDAEGINISYAVYENDCGNLAEVTCADPAWPDLGATGIVGGLTPGETYYVQLYSTWFDDPTAPTSFKVCVATPASIVVDTTMDLEETVNKGLQVEGCVVFENMTSSTGTDFGEENGIGYFEKGLSNFSIEKGIVLMTGDANKAPGPNLGGKLSDQSWPGDADLFNYIQGLGIDPGLGSYNDATVVEFDFTPLANRLRFPFIFASEEYGTFQCSFSDAFAFFLTPIDEDGNPTGETVNLAVVPETNAPVSVVTIRDDAFNPMGQTCASANPDFFDAYYGNDGVNNPELATDPLLAPINFQGSTIKMFAQSDVIPNQKYHIKLVIADRNDGGMDSAVFIGAFDVGTPNLGDDQLIADGNGICHEESYTITSDLDPDDYTFTWYRRDYPAGPDEEFVLIEGQTGPTLVVPGDDINYGTGEYKSVASFNDLCSAEDSVIIEFHPDLVVAVAEPIDLFFCDADGFGTFNLSDNNAVVLAGKPVAEGGQGPLDPAVYAVTYYASEEDAIAEADALPETGYDNIVQTEQTVWVRVESANGCFVTKDFNLVVGDKTPVFTINENFSICENTTGTISVSPEQPAGVTYSWTLDGNPLPDTTASITVAVGGTYEVTVNNTGCTATDSVEMAVIPTPIADDPADVIACNSYTLPALSANNVYFASQGATGTQLNAGDVIEASATIYVVAFSSENTACFSENSFEVQIIPSAMVSVEETCQGNDYVLTAQFEDDSIYNADNVTFSWANAAGTVLGTSESLTITETGSYFLTVTPAGQPMACPTTVEVQVDSTTCLIPRGISPNGDGKNDSFDLTTLDVSMLKIFNRYGQEVYSKGNYTNEWIGQGSNGDELPSGTYFYMIKRVNGESKTGWVYINRQE